MKKYSLFRVTTIPLSLNFLLKNQLNFLSKHFHVTGIASPGSDLLTVKEREGIDVIEIPMMREISPIRDFHSLIKLTSIFSKYRPDILHANTPKASLLCMLAGAIAGVKIRIYTITGLRFETETGMKRSLLIFMEKVTCFFATHVNAESRGVQRMVKDYNLTSKPAGIIGNGNINGIDEHFWDRSQISAAEISSLKVALAIDEKDFVFIFVGRLVKDKGVNELVEAFDIFAKEVKNAKLMLVGSVEAELNPLLPRVLETIQTNDRIISVGFKEDVRKFLAISNVLVLPSYREGFSNVLLQAGAMRLPAIVTDVNGVEEVIDNRNGIVIKKRDIASLLQAMRLIYKHPEKIDLDHCRKKIVENFSQQQFYPKLLSYYQSLIQEGDV